MSRLRNILLVLFLSLGFTACAKVPDGNSRFEVVKEIYTEQNIEFWILDKKTGQMCVAAWWKNDGRGQSECIENGFNKLK